MRGPQRNSLGARIRLFVKSQYIPRLAEIKHIVYLKAIWSRTKKSAREAVEIARKEFPNVECKWGDEGLDDIIRDVDIIAVAVVLAGQIQVDMSLKLLKGGKHVLQENYRFEPAFVEGRKLVSQIGEMMSVQLIVDGSMNSSNPYFSSSWRRDLALAGCEITSVSAVTSHVNTDVPPPDIISSIFQLENGCSGVFVLLVSTKNPKIVWRVVGLNGTVQVEHGNKDGQPGNVVTLINANKETKSTFYPYTGVIKELKTFFEDVFQNVVKVVYHKDKQSTL
ncbi:NAD(P)-binding Rossmann-fold superfamily protein, partial [Tanacetum coccineum]